MVGIVSTEKVLRLFGLLKTESLLLILHYAQKEITFMILYQIRSTKASSCPLNGISLKEAIVESSGQFKKVKVIINPIQLVLKFKYWIMKGIQMLRKILNTIKQELYMIWYNLLKMYANLQENGII